MHYNSKKDSLEIKDHYYAVAHFSKFIERDALRLGTTTFADLISIAAFRNPDGKIIAVIANLDDRDHKTSLRMNEYVSKNILPAHSITTVVIEEIVMKRAGKRLFSIILKLDKPKLMIYNYFYKSTP